jgi:hypothetical protein
MGVTAQTARHLPAWRTPRIAALRGDGIVWIPAFLFLDQRLQSPHSKETLAMNRSFLPLTAAALVGITLLPGLARAQDPAAPPPATTVTTQETTSQATGPSLAMVGSGVVIFGLSYLPAVVVGASSGLNADRTLFVPLVGPWIDLTQRPGCSPASTCNAENTAKVALVVDGIFQGIGVLTILGGFLTTAHETKTVQRAADLRPTLHLTPAQVGGSGYGMVALGTF